MGQATLAFWQLLLLSVGPAFLTACVALGAPLLLEGRKQEVEKRKKRAEKLEELIQALYDHADWLEKKRSITVFGTKAEIGVTPLSKAQAIVYLYFPQFKSELSLVTLKASQYEVWMAEAGKKRLNNDFSFTEDFHGVYNPYALILNETMNAIAKFAQDELHTVPPRGFNKFYSPLKTYAGAKFNKVFPKE